MREQLRALVRLSEIDDSASGIDKELRELPQRVAETRADLERLEGLLDGERRELVEAEELARAYDEQIGGSTDQLTRAKTKGAKARNAREAEAAEREMEAVRRTIKEREDEQLRLAEAIEQKKASLGEREAKLGEFRTMYEEEDALAKVRVEELLAERARVTEGREAIAAKVGAALVRRYERIREKRGNAVAEVVDATCRGCRVQLPPQFFNELHTAQEVMQCPQCIRFLYLRQVIED